MKSEKNSGINLFFCVVIGVIMVFTSNSCEQKPLLDTNISKFKIDDLHYLVEFIEKSKTVNNNVCIDSFNILYRSLIAYSLDDSNFIFASIYKEKVLLIFSNDSIKIYKGSLTNSFTWLESEVGLILEGNGKNNVDTAISIIKKELEPIYLYNRADCYIHLLAFNRKVNEFFILDYYWRNWVGLSFGYVATIKNEYVKLNNIKFIDVYPYEINSLKYVSPHLSEILRNRTAVKQQ